MVLKSLHPPPTAILNMLKESSHWTSKLNPKRCLCFDKHVGQTVTSWAQISNLFREEEQLTSQTALWILWDCRMTNCCSYWQPVIQEIQFPQTSTIRLWNKGTREDVSARRQKQEQTPRKISATTWHPPRTSLHPDILDLVEFCDIKLAETETHTHKPFALLDG